MNEINASPLPNGKLPRVRYTDGDLWAAREKAKDAARESRPNAALDAALDAAFEALNIGPLSEIRSRDRRRA